MSSIIFLYLFVSITTGSNGQKPKWNKLRNRQEFRFTKINRHSDDFLGNELNHEKWDVHALRNDNTGCPQWNGPVNLKEPKYSTYHQTTTNIDGNEIDKDKLNYRVLNGYLQVRTTTEDSSYFKSREYFCDKKTFRCNHDRRIRCFGTNYNGEPILKDKKDPKSYLWINHDKCKKEPFCIPHPYHVVGASRAYEKYLGVNLAMKKQIRYGFFETRGRIANSPAVTAVWMHDDNIVPGYDRWTFDPDKGWYIFESPTAIRSRRWQEIDMLEAMNAEHEQLFRQYIPNIHVFAGYKGEFTASNLSNGKLGPIVLDRGVFMQPVPLFNPPNPDRSNSWHLNCGNTKWLSSPWATKWYTIGMYWSPREIRFFLDGEETLRLKNKLVHQPMLWTIGTGLNKDWAGTAPNEKEIGRWSKIDYVRRWTVKGPEIDADPPSDMPLLSLMETGFASLGNEYRAVDNLFPVRDDGQTIPDPPVRFFGQMIEKLKTIASAEKISNIKHKNPRPQNLSFPKNTSLLHLVDIAGDSRERYETFDLYKGFPTGLRTLMVTKLKRAQYSRIDRFRSPNENPSCDFEASRTVFDAGVPPTGLCYDSVD